MNETRKMKVGQIVWIAVVVGIVAVLLLIFSAQNKNRIINQNANYVQDNAIQTTKQINDVMSRTQEDIRMMAYLFGETLDEPEVSTEDLKNLTERSHFDYVRFTDKNGINYAADGRTNDASDREYFREGMNGKTGISVTWKSRITEETLVNFYTPLEYNGEIIGVLRGVYLADKRMRELLSTTFFGEEAIALMCTSDGMMIAGNDGAKSLPRNIREYLSNEELFGEECAKSIESAFKTGRNTGFTFNTEDGTGSGYISRLDDPDWFLVQTFPSKVTTRMYKSANSAGVILEVSLIVLFAVYLVIVVMRNRRRNKLLIDENRDMSYVIHGIPKLYDRFVLIDLEENTYRYMMGEKPEYGMIFKEGSYDEFKRYTLNTVREEADMESVEAFMDPDEIRRSFENGVHDLMLDYRSIDGISDWRRIYLVCLERRKGNPSKILFAKQNITETKKRETAEQDVLKEAKQAAEASNNAKTKFLFNMSHDIRTPMNAIIGFANMAQKHAADTDSVKEYISKIQKSSDVLLKIINNILDMARIESGKTELKLVPVDLLHEIEGMEDMFAESMEQAGLQFSTDVDIRDAQVICDNLKITQICINLLSNAQKFTPEGGTVAFSLKQLDAPQNGIATYEFCVKDNGIGMNEEFMEHMFKPFEREHTATVSGIQGAGLGLSIVKNLVEMMDGEITVDSSPGKGTEIIMRFEFSVTSDDTLRPQGSDDLAEVDFTGNRVLLVEDNELNREIACEILKEDGFEVEEAHDGYAAVRMLKDAGKGYYDIVLMDIQMPGIDGYETTRLIRALDDPDIAGIPIIATTANAFEEDRKAAQAAGMDGHIGKPIDVKQMKRTIAEVLKAKGQ